FHAGLSADGGCLGGGGGWAAPPNNPQLAFRDVAADAEIGADRLPRRQLLIANPPELPGAARGEDAAPPGPLSRTRRRSTQHGATLSAGHRKQGARGVGMKGGGKYRLRRADLDERSAKEDAD